jgi:4-azaleucine resistance transporter AzlC
MAVETRPVERAVPGDVRRGFLAMMPLWIGVMPFGATFAILARGNGFSVVETQALSMLVFAGSAQLAVVTLAAAGSGFLVVVLTVLLLNLRHVLYAVSLRRLLEPPIRPPRWLLAFLLTDESYGLAIREFFRGRGSAGFLFGASLSLYVSFAVATLAGALLGGRISQPERIGLDFIFPLSFLALLLPLLRTRRHLAVAMVAVLMALVLGPRIDGGVTVLFATTAAAACGALLGTRRSEG